MNNIFFEKKHSEFSWEMIGDIREGRQELGEEMPVLVYRLLEYTMNSILTKEYGEVRANELFVKAGYLAGSEFAKNVLDLTADFDHFIAQLQNTLKDLKIGILRVEHFDKESGGITLTVEEDLDCSGLPPTGEVVCDYDEGFLAGILDTYTGKTYIVREIDCWSSGARVCRFRGELK